LTETTLADLRRALVEARDMHRMAEDALKAMQAAVELAIIEEWASDYNRLTNEPARARFLATHLNDTESYRRAVRDERLTRTECERLGAEIEIHEDARKARDQDLRAREADLTLRMLEARERETSEHARMQQEALYGLNSLRESVEQGVMGVAVAPLRRDFDA
jgi:hypothetical protein